MIYYILLDLNIAAWEKCEEDPLNNLQVFINAVVLSRYGNAVKVINNRTLIYDSQNEVDFKEIIKYAETTEGFRITPKDLGYALIENPDEILIYEMSNEDSNMYLEYLKCMFVAQSKNIKINGFSLRHNMLIKMLAEGTGGKYLENCNLKSLIGLLSLPANKNESYEISCSCCNKYVNIGMVCPICLAVYCKFIPVCRRCKTKFSFAKPT